MRCATLNLNFVLLLAFCTCAGRAHVLQRREIIAEAPAKEQLIPVTIVEEGVQKQEKEDAAKLPLETMKSAAAAETRLPAEDNKQENKLEDGSKLNEIKPAAEQLKAVEPAAAQLTAKPAEKQLSQKQPQEVQEQPKAAKKQPAAAPAQLAQASQPEAPQALPAIEELPEALPLKNLNPELATAAVEKNEIQQLEQEQEQTQPAENEPILKNQPAEDIQKIPEVAPVVQSNNAAEEALPSFRQATPATPPQSSTQQNFVQQLLQNSPIGQFLNQFTPQQQQQQQPQPQADQPAAPTPTVPGFLNPASAITSAQQAVQNVVNTTTQAFQGIQQFASNLGNQFQNTLSGLTGQNAGSTTPRPPGPIQSFINNLTGSNNSTTAAAAANAPAAGQPQGPFQGIINFLQGNNRPQAATATTTTTLEPAVDDKVEAVGGDYHETQQDPESDDNNEVRNSGENVDSFEEAVPAEEVIAVKELPQQPDKLLPANAQNEKPAESAPESESASDSQPEQQ